ncbi:PP2C family protein-serine/threonine phosphatase [Streptomyces sp. CB00455]|uniref:PP2C family protein-serine/threonine phosphatase n=1 Tax=Streptomyces sp. CB00455 TaxID=1703927 RepID=UPI00093CF761|nr:PP2C family protein-serine/threonine phosphatase [Streptomyces sp. CB00455]
MGKVQRAVLRELPDQVCGYQVAGTYRSADPEARVGGDFYEALATPYGLRVVLGDVCGKGLPAVDATVTLLGAFREAAYQEADLTDVARRMDQSLLHRQEATGDARFASALLVQATAGGRMTLVNCGHVPPLHIEHDGRVREIPLPAGLLLGLPDSGRHLPPATAHTLPSGACLLAATDGITEARDPGRTFFDLVAAVARHPHTGARDRIRTLLDELHLHTRGHLNDDVAALAIACPEQVRAGTADRQAPPPAPTAAAG